MVDIYYTPSDFVKETYHNYSIGNDIKLTFVKNYELPYYRLKVFEFTMHKDGTISDVKTYIKSDTEQMEKDPGFRIESSLGFNLSKNNKATIRVDNHNEDGTITCEFYVVYTQKDSRLFNHPVIPEYKTIEFLFRIKGSNDGKYILPVYMEFPKGINLTPFQEIDYSLNRTTLIQDILSDLTINYSNIGDFLRRYSSNVELDESKYTISVLACTLEGEVNTLTVPYSSISGVYFELIGLRIL